MDKKYFEEQLDGASSSDLTLEERRKLLRKALLKRSKKI